MHFLKPLLRSLIFAGLLGAHLAAAEPTRPHIVLVMADDMGWGETSYNGHPVLKTPNLDAMAAAGLRFDRFYAGAPNCSPTRATVMTGRNNDRCGVETAGFALRLQEKTLPRALRDAGYRTAHFGKWHLNGFRGPGVPVLKEDDHNPSAFGFETWLSVTNFFDRDPLLSRQGKFESFRGDSSEIIVDEALRYLEQNRGGGKPLFVVIWYGSPHAPFNASAADRAAFSALAEKSQHHFGELVALDRSVGTLRAGLRRLGLANDTLLWFCSDNGGLPEVKPSTVGPLRGFKNSLYEGGLRVPAIIEWPGVIAPRVTQYPAGTMDIFPTLADLLGLPPSVLLAPVDGTSLKPIFGGEIGPRARPLGFHHRGRAALVDNQFKVLMPDVNDAKIEVYDLEHDVAEAHDLSAERPELAGRMRAAVERWNASVAASYAGRDYPEGNVSSREPKSRDWMTAPEYKPYLDELRQRPEYRNAAADK